MFLSNFLAKHFPQSDLSHTFFPPDPTFTIDDIPDLSGKVIIVTGGNVGIGWETVKALLKKNAKVYLAARDETKAKKAISELKEQTGKEAIFLKLDLGNLASIKKTAEEFTSKEKKLDVLFNNAGVMTPPNDLLTSDNYDLQWGTNVLGSYYFTKLLIPALKASKQATGEPARVINTSSSAHFYAPTDVPNKVWNPDTFIGGEARDAQIKKWGGLKAKANLYGQSKAGNVAHANYLAREYPGEIVAASLHPGIIRSNLVQHLNGTVSKLIHFFAWPQPYGALTQLHAGTIATPNEMNGKFFVPWAREGIPNQYANDPARSEDLVNWCEEQIRKLA